MYKYSFLLSIVLMPYLSGNAPCNIFYVLLGGDIFSIGRTTTGFNKFELSCETRLSRMINGGAKLKFIEQCS